MTVGRGTRRILRRKELVEKKYGCTSFMTRVFQVTTKHERGGEENDVNGCGPLLTESLDITHRRHRRT